MRRRGHHEKTARRIESWRKICPALAVRSTFIVGFHGETEQDFTALLDFLIEAKLARVGCFKYGMSMAPRPTRFPIRCRKRSRASAGFAPNRKPWKLVGAGLYVRAY
jgi:hypothetical protein